MIKQLLQTAVLSIGLINCSYRPLPHYFFTEVHSSENSIDLNLQSHIQEAKREIRNLTGKDYNEGILDLDYDGIDDAFILLDYPFVYATLSSNSRGKHSLENRLWFMVNPDVIGMAAQRFIDEPEREKLDVSRNYPGSRI